MIWTRKSGSTIELKDTPNMEKFAKSQGWVKQKAKKAPKKAKKAE